MAAGTPVLVDNFMGRIGDSTANWATDDHYFMLVLAAQTPATTDDTRADVIANVAVGDFDYEDAVGESVVETTGTVVFDANIVDFGPSPVTILARYIYCLDGTAAATSNADTICFYMEMEVGADVSSTNGDFTVDWHANGIWDHTRA